MTDNLQSSGSLIQRIIILMMAVVFVMNQFDQIYTLLDQEVIEVCERGDLEGEENKKSKEEVEYLTLIKYSQHQSDLLFNPSKLDRHGDGELREVTSTVQTPPPEVLV